jgi:hypothetical protein
MALSHGLCLGKRQLMVLTTPALFALAVMFSEPAHDLATYVPAGVVPDENQNLLANRQKLLTAPSEKLCRYTAHGPAIHEPEPRLIALRQIEPITGDGLP